MFIIIEIQKDAAGKVATVVTTKETRHQADAEFHRVLAAAALSELPVHGAAMLSDDGYPIRNESYRHGAGMEE